MTAPVLAIPDPDVAFELIPDLSGYGVGTMLVQQGRPVAYHSRKMVAAERTYVNHEQGLLATMTELKLLRCCLRARRLTWLLTPSRRFPINKLDGVDTCSAPTMSGCTYLVKPTLPTP